MATSHQVSEYREAQASIARAAIADMRAFMRSLPEGANREQLIASFVHELIETYGDMAAGVAAQYYDEIRDSSVAVNAYRALTAGVVPAQVAGATAWALSTDSVDALIGVVDRLVKQAGRDTFFGNVANDSDSRARWIRVPQGETCAFCLMLASRGYEGGYASKEAALRVVGRKQSARNQYNKVPARTRGKRDIGEKFHDFCDCTTVQVYSESDYPDNYDYDKYNNIYTAASKEVGSGTKDVLAQIRRLTGSH